MFSKNIVRFGKLATKRNLMPASQIMVRQFGSEQKSGGMGMTIPLVAAVGAVGAYTFFGSPNNKNSAPSGPQPPQPPYPGLKKPVTGEQYVTGYPNLTPKHKSAMAKHLTPEIYNKYKDVKTKLGVSFQQCIKTGVDTPHLGVGMTAGDESAYETYKDIFYPIIKEWHKYDPYTQKHVSDLNANNLKWDRRTAALFDKYVISTRIRAARSLRGHYLPSNTTAQDRKAVEQTLKNIFENKFTDELKGKYYPLGSLTPEQNNFLRSNGFLFQKPRPTNLLYFSGAANDWPEGRGIFHNNEHTFLAWVNEEDHCRIISMCKGGDVKEVFARFCKASKLFSNNAEIMFSDRLGFIGTCPSNLGTGLRASVMIKLPEFNKDVHLLEKACSKLDLQPRGSAGEHSAAVGAKWDVSNKQRIGFSEVQLVQKMIDGVLQIIAWEERLARGDKRGVLREINRL